jgi:hypothetical protein
LAVLGLVGWLGVGHDRLSAGGVLAGEDEQGAQQGGGFAAVDAEAGEGAPVLEVAEGVLDGCAGGGVAWFAWRWAGVVLLVRVDLQPVMMTGSSGSGSRPVKPRSARRPAA